MSFKMRNVMLTAGMILMATVGTAHASTTIIEANVPVPFVVNGQTLPAGKYRIERESASVLLIRGENKNGPAAYVATLPDSGLDPAGSKPALVLKQHEGQYQLASVWESTQQGWDVTGQ